MFQKYNTDGSGLIDIEQLKKMMEKLGNPQTHVSLRSMIAEIDEDADEKINFREFLMIFRKSAAGELSDSPFASLVTEANEINVQEVGVSGAKAFFEAKADKLKQGNDFEEQIKAEQEAKRKEREEKASRAAAFKERRAMFGN